MQLRYFLILMFANPQSDTTIAYGPDIGGASQKLTDMIQLGGPDGIVAGTLVSNKRLIKSVALKSKAWHEEQRNLSLSANDRKDALERQEKRLDIERRFSVLQAEAEENGILLPMANLVVVSDDLIKDSPLTPVDMSELMHGSETGEITLSPEASAALSSAPIEPTASSAQAEPAANATAPAGASKKGAGTSKKPTQEPAKVEEGAADSDSASNGPGVSGDLLEGA